MAVRVVRSNQNLDGIIDQILVRQRGVANDLLRRGYRVEAQAKRNVTRNTNTGNLRSSIHTELHARRGHPYVTIGTPLFYAPFIHHGTRPHGPVTARAMAWYGEDGNIIFAHRVRGITANPFLTDALIAARY